VAEESNPNNDLLKQFRYGYLIAFVHQKRFRVKLENGITIEAVMSNELMSQFDPNLQLTVANRPYVQVEMREPPALPKIVFMRSSPLCGPG
jgi:hypothetical protein